MVLLSADIRIELSHSDDQLVCSPEQFDAGGTAVIARIPLQA
jgi:hypothetical protein